MVAILDADTMLGRALSLLLEDWGYDTIPLDSYPTGVVDELLEGAHLLLLVPGVDERVREAFLGAMGKSTLQVGDMPVIALSTAVEEIPALTVIVNSKAARAKARLGQSLSAAQHTEGYLQVVGVGEWRPTSTRPSWNAEPRLPGSEEGS